MKFNKYEIENLIKTFPYEKASLFTDFEQFELDAISQLGVLKDESHLYLGIVFIQK